MSSPGGKDGPELSHLRTKVVTEEYIEHGFQCDFSKKLLPETLAVQVRSMLAKKGFVTVVEQIGNA